MEDLQRAGIALLMLLLVFGGSGVLTSWGPSAYAQGERQEQETLSGLLVVLAMTLAKTPEINGVLGAAFAVAPEIARFTNWVSAELQARPDLSSVQDVYNVLADQEKFTPLVREVLKAAIANNGGDVTKVESQIDAFTPNIQGFQITALEQIPDGDFDTAVGGFLRTIDTSKTEDSYWDSQVDPFVSRVRTNMLGDAAFEDVAILARTIAAYTHQSADEIINGDEERTLQAIADATKGLGEAYKNLLNAALRRVRSLRLASLAQQVDQLTSALAQMNNQLDAIQQELEELKGRRDPLPLALAIVALVLAAGALGLAAVRQRAG